MIKSCDETIYITDILKCEILNCFLVEPEMPEHNLEPPRFSRRALERILNDWTAVKSMLMTGCKEINRPAR